MACETKIGGAIEEKNAESRQILLILVPHALYSISFLHFFNDILDPWAAIFEIKN
jgi:hypothetical protein